MVPLLAILSLTNQSLLAVPYKSIVHNDFCLCLEDCYKKNCQFIIEEHLQSSVILFKTFLKFNSLKTENNAKCVIYSKRNLLIFMLPRLLAITCILNAMKYV